MAIQNKIEMIAIGGSFGALEALTEILINLAAGSRIPIVVVLHRNRDSNEDSIVEYFSSNTDMTIKEVGDQENLAAGVLYFAPGGYHILAEDRKRLILYLDKEVNYSRPSIDLFFESAADIFGPQLTGILLSGANSDGANGICKIKKHGGVAIIQDPTTALAQAMPQSALDLCRPDRVETPLEIANTINNLNGDTTRQ